MTDTITAAWPSQDVLDYLLTRRSVPIPALGEPGPDAAQLETILQAAARVPDHGRLFPWHFLVFAGAARAEAGALLESAWRGCDPAASAAKLEIERTRFLRAPLVVGVISRIREGKAPLWEQVLSAGAVCQTLALAAHASGFGANWVTEWYAYDPAVKAGLGLDARDHVAGFIYIGALSALPEERERPALSALVTQWSPGAAIRNGPEYGRVGLGFPEAGFDFSALAPAAPNTAQVAEG